MAISNLQSLERNIAESVVEELRRHGIVVQDDSDRRLASIIMALLTMSMQRVYYEAGTVAKDFICSLYLLCKCSMH